MHKTKKVLSAAAIGTLMVIAAPFALAQTSTTTSTTTPGTPDTGLGGDAGANAAMLAVSAAAVIGAAAYLARQRHAAH